DAAGERRAIEDGDARAAAEPGRDHEIAEAVAIEVADGGAGPAAEARIVDAEEVADAAEVAAVEKDDARAAALIRRDGDLVHAVVVDVADGHEHAALEGIEGEVSEDLLAGVAVDHQDRGGNAGAGADDVIGHAVARDVADSHANPAHE